MIEPHEIVGDLMLTRLKKIHQVLKEIKHYFDTHQAKENSEYFSQPIKYLKNYNLLTLQLSDLTFRKTIMFQVLLFTHALKHPLTRTPIPLTEADRKVIS